MLDWRKINEINDPTLRSIIIRCTLQILKNKKVSDSEIDLDKNHIQRILGEEIYKDFFDTAVWWEVIEVIQTKGEQAGKSEAEIDLEVIRRSAMPLKLLREMALMICDIKSLTEIDDDPNSMIRIDLGNKIREYFGFVPDTEIKVFDDVYCATAHIMETNTGRKITTDSNDDTYNEGFFGEGVYYHALLSENPLEFVTLFGVEYAIYEIKLEGDPDGFTVHLIKKDQLQFE